MKNYFYTMISTIEGIYYEEAEESSLFNAVHKLGDSYSLFISSHLPLGYQILPDRDKSIYYKVQKMLKLHYMTCGNILDSSVKGVDDTFRVRKFYDSYIVCGPNHHIMIEPKGVRLVNYSAKNRGYEYIIYPDTFYNILQRTKDFLIELDKVWESI